MRAKLLTALVISWFFHIAVHAQTFEKVSELGVNANFLCTYNDNLFFPGDSIDFFSSGLCKSDGTPTGTRLIRKNIDFYGNDFPGPRIVYNGKLYFLTLADPSDDGLWVTDGTNSGTQMIKNIPYFGFDMRDFTFINYADKFYFFAYDSTTLSSAFWTSDGTPAGTKIIFKWPDFFTGNTPSGNIVVFKNKLYFGAPDTSDGYNALEDLWISDGTVTGTKIVSKGSGPLYGNMIEYHGKLFYQGLDVTLPGGLIVSDGTSSGTHALKDINPTGFPFIIYNDRLFFGASDTLGTEGLWESDGTANGTQLVKGNVIPEYFSNLDGKLFFAGQDSVHGSELWVSDGTTSGTQLIKDILEGKSGSYPYNFAEYSNKLYFQANDSIHGVQLYVTDGTTAGTQMLEPYDIIPKAAVGNNPMVVYKGSLYFAADYNQNDTVGYVRNLWKLTTNTPEVSTNGFSLYPNPVRGEYIYLQGDDFSSSVQVQLFTIEGKLIFTRQLENINSSGVIPVQLPENIANTMYLIAVTTDQKTYYQKIIIQR